MFNELACGPDGAGTDFKQKKTAAWLGWASRVSPTQVSPLIFLQRRYRGQREKPPELKNQW